jgi:hypothetical protein
MQVSITEANQKDREEAALGRLGEVKINRVIVLKHIKLLPHGFIHKHLP